MSKRFFVTLPDSIGEALDRWAESERNKPASLAAFLLERMVREAMDQGRIPAAESEPQHDYKKFSQVVMHNMSKLVESGKFPNGRLKELMSGQKPSEVELLRVALICGLSEDYLANLPINGEAKSDAASRVK